VATETRTGQWKMKTHVLQLTKVEKAWIESYRKALDERYPDSVHEMLIYGSKARGQAHAESDLDVLLIVKNKTGRLKRTLRRIGYLLAATSDVLPSIIAYTEDEWESRKRSGSSFRQAVERDGVRVA
jgi:predicted nucleotidyltransferase